MEALLDRPPAFAPRPGREGPAEAVAEAAVPYGEVAAPYGGKTVGTESADRSIRLVGRAFNLFILIERGDRLFIIDQHAAHERFLYNGFLSKPIPTQELLVPLPFTTENDEEDRFLRSRREELARLGIVLESEGNGNWRIEALPAGWRIGDRETVRQILTLRTAGENLAEHWAATLSCHSAVKDGDYLDDTAALALAEAALSFPDPRCPHGRPLWTEISREELFRAVRRL
jgi:DNA mismatch repair protein MutL